MKLKKTDIQEVAGLKVGITRKTAGKYIREGKLPSELKQQREWLTRSDCFQDVWPTLAAMLSNAPGLEAKTLLEWLIEQKNYTPPFHFGQLRTLQRRVRDWRALHGPERSVIFPQNILPGRQSQSDCTCMNSLNIRIAGATFHHLLFHWMLPYSRWETVSICFTESFASLTAGYTAAVWELGAVAPEHRTDNLTAATHSFGNSREFNKSWNDFLKHHGVKPSRNNPGESHENGSVEKSNDLIKRNVEQQLLLRGSRNFASIDDYNVFLQRIMKQRNQSRQARLAEDLVHFLPLPKRRWEAVQTLSVTVGPASIISVLKGVYSVPARLIGYGLDVDIYPKHLNVRYGRKVIESIPRLPNDRGVAVNYRHIIGYLLRKPGAFAHYQYRECLFPRLAFRKAYDALMEQSPARGHKNYIQVLHLAAIGSESGVTAALELLMESGDVPLPDAVKKLLDLPSDAHPTVRVIQPKLGDYDRLLTTFNPTTQGAPMQFTDLGGTLKNLCLTLFVERYQAEAERCEKEGVDHVGYLTTLARGEWERRQHQRIERLLKHSKIPRDKRLIDFEITRIPGLSPSLVHRLADGEFIDHCENILIFGNPGTGKTHLCIALAREWCLKGRRVLYTTACKLVQELLRAKQAFQLDLAIRRLDRYEVIVIDDLSYVTCDRNETDVLFALLAERYEQRSIVITSNLVFSQWHQIFKDEMTAAAAIDRLVHHATVLELNAVESYRMEHAKGRKKAGTEGGG